MLIDGGLNVDQFDLAALVANALDNAIEGIQRSGDVDRTIQMSIASVSDYVSVLVENPASGPINKDFSTTKPDRGDHGFGLKQIRTIAQKYNGDVEPYYDAEYGKFCLSVLLRN